MAAPAQAQLCDSSMAMPAADGRVLGHLPYGTAAAEDLMAVPSARAAGGCLLRREVLPDLERLLAAAAAPEVGGRIMALSCHCSIAYQQDVFCRERTTAADARAWSVAPPGHSEHATGYALDFAFRPRVNGCPDAQACIAATPAFRWLLENGPRYGFELSFPAGNAQGVKWEPWHWRWVGTEARATGAARARFVFARARQAFPAAPAVAAPAVLVHTPPPPVMLAAIEPPQCRKGKCRATRQR